MKNYKRKIYFSDVSPRMLPNIKLSFTDLTYTGITTYILQKI